MQGLGNEEAALMEQLSQADYAVLELMKVNTNLIEICNVLKVIATEMRNANNLRRGS